MKGIHSLVVLSLVVFLSACATGFQGGTDISSGRRALFAGNYQAALSSFQAAAQTDPNYIYGTELREGVLSYLGRAQYLTGNYTQAQQTLEKALLQHNGDNVARLYLGLTQVRLGDRQGGLKNIQLGLKGINDFINYLTTTMSYGIGQYWDPGRSIRNACQNALTLASSANVDWPLLLSQGESIAMQVEQEGERADAQQQRDRQMNLMR